MPRKKILWLCSWYPGKAEPFNGDFIQRHARAAALYNDIYVIYITGDATGKIKNNLEEEFNQSGNLTEQITYFRKSSSFIGRIVSRYRLLQLYKNAVKKYMLDKGKPDLVHIQVGIKMGIIAGWLRKKMQIDYVVSEHWSGFLPEAADRYKALPFYYKKIWQKLMRGAKSCSAVSDYLGNALKVFFPETTIRVIPNVVDTGIFNWTNTKPENLKFIHISNLDDLKNPEYIIRAFKIITQTQPDAELEIFGSTRQSIVQLAKDLGLSGHISFDKEVPQSLLAQHIQSSVALIQYSSYETFGCVIIEANACGVPVIVSDIPAFHETVKEGENGYFVALNNPVDLAEKMMLILNNRSSFDAQTISIKTASKYGYEVVGKQFDDWYQDILQKNS